MQIIDLDKNNVKINIDAITLGNFDGLHLAHQKLINKSENQIINFIILINRKK